MPQTALGQRIAQMGIGLACVKGRGTRRWPRTRGAARGNLRGGGSVRIEAFGLQRLDPDGAFAQVGDMADGTEGWREQVTGHSHFRKAHIRRDQHSHGPCPAPHGRHARGGTSRITECLGREKDQRVDPGLCHEVLRTGPVQKCGHGQILQSETRLGSHVTSQGKATISPISKSKASQ